MRDDYLVSSYYLVYATTSFGISSVVVLWTIVPPYHSYANEPYVRTLMPSCIVECESHMA
jgi:hypothetical protein